jgi:cellulose synthase/poly-beta-1,6-N-acetylglucosamine synthase-like glycosyltransferase
MVTVIYPIKDKEPKRLVNSVRSLKENTTQDVTFIVVDYGSSKKYTSGLRKVCKEENLRLIRVESQGLPWNKAHALNIGVEATDSEFIALVDVDIVFEDDVIGFSMKYYSENSVIHGQIYLLPKTGIKKFGKPCSPPAAGAYIFLKRKDFLDVDGFDERVNFWGHEDFDLNEKFL